MKKILLILIAYFLLIPQTKAQENNIVNIYLFHSNTCEHCKEEIKFLELLEKKYPNVYIYKYEISDINNTEILNKVEELYNIKINSVPLTIIGDKYYKGYSSEKTSSKIIGTINYYSTYGYQDKIGEFLKNIKLPKEETQNNKISLEDYLKKNISYNIIFNIKSNDIDINTTSTLLGIRASLNILNLLLIITIIVITKKNNNKEKIIIYGLYIISTIIFEILNQIINQNLIFISIYIVIIIIIIILLSYYKKIKHIIKYISIIGLTGGLLIVKNIIGNNEIDILKKILELNLASPFKTITNIIIYIFTYILINAIIILLINKINLNLHKNKLVVQK